MLSYTSLATSFVNDGGLGVFGGEAYERSAASCLCTCYVLAVDLIDILDELSVEEVERDALRTYSAALSTVGASARYVEGTDDVEHLLLEGVNVCLLCGVELGAVKYALTAGACGAYVSARVASDALGELSLEELELLGGSHCFDLLNLCESFLIAGVAGLADELVVDLVLLALANVAALKHTVVVGAGLLSVDGIDSESVASVGHLSAADSDNALDSGLLDLLDIELTLTANADYVRLVAVNSMLGEELVEAVAVAGLEANESLALELGCLDHIFGKVCAAEAVVNKLIKALYGLKECGLGIVGHIADLPAQNSCYGTVRKELLCASNQFLHLRSPSLTFSPRSRILATKSFIVSENLTPSAADTHSTRVRPFSTPI